jgi:uncharacterized protein
MAARVGLMTVVLCVTGAMTLKDKRQVVRSLLDRVADRMNVAVAETGRLDSPRRAELSFAVVSNDGQHAAEMLAAVLRMLEAEPRAVVEESQVELL